MKYQLFYLAIRRYMNKKISRGMFLIDWKDAQRREGIEPVDWREKSNGRKN